MQLVKLNISLEEFNTEINELIRGGDAIRAIPVKDGTELNKIAIRIEMLEAEVISILEKSFTPTYTNLIMRMKRLIKEPETDKPERYRLQEKYNGLMQGLDLFLRNLEKERRLIGAFDIVISDIDYWETRKNYSIDEKTNLILEKLYDLYDDNLYPLNDIIIGNGITFRRQNEEQELANLLLKKQLIHLTNKEGITLVMLSIEGANYIEERRKKLTERNKRDYKSIDELHAKIDLLAKDLKTQGYGQEIIYDELQEIKDILPHLSKKGFRQYLMGKLADLATEQVINKEMAQKIFKDLTDTVLHSISN